MIFRGLNLALGYGLLTVVAPIPAFSETLTANSILDWSYVADPRFSADGSHLAYTRVTTDRESDSYRSRIVVVESERAPRALTELASNAHTPRWSPDGRYLAFLSTRSGSQQVWAFDRRGGEARALTDVDGSVRTFAWSPTADQLALVAVEPASEGRGPFVTTELILRADGQRGYVDADPPRLAVVSTSGAEPGQPRWLTGPIPLVGDVSWSADGTQIYFAAPPTRADGFTQTDVYAVDVESASTERVTTSSGPDRAYPSPDGRWLAVVGTAFADPPASYQTSELRILDLTGESPERSLTDAYDFSVGDDMAGDVNAPVTRGQTVVWTPDSKGLIFTSAANGRVQLMRADLETATVEALTQIDSGELRDFDVSSDGRIAAVFSRHDLPPNLVTFDLSQGRRGAWRQRTTLNSELLSSRELAGYEEILVPATTADSGALLPELQAWLISPPKLDRRRKYPLLLYIHGGPHAMYGANFFHEFQVLAAAGYHVLIVNPRGSSGYGGEFGNSIQYKYPGDDASDLLRALDYVLDRVDTIDPDRLGVAGGSGGGLLTTWLVANTDRFKAASAHRSVTNWLSFVGTADLNQMFVRHWFEQAPWADPAAYLERSPIAYVDRVETPVQIIHSDRDYRTPLEQSLQYYTALRMLDKPAELVIFEDESHGLSRGGRPSNRLARLNAILRWFDRHLRADRARR